MKPWIEVWIDAASGEYLLLVRQDADGRVEINDPQEGSRTIQLFATYEEACHWLNEDEYDLVEGRWTKDEV